MTKLIWPITVLLSVAIVTAGAPFTIRALREPVGPAPAPVVNTFTADVKAAFDSLANEDKQVFRDHTLSMVALASLPNAAGIKDTEALHTIVGNARMALYGTVDPLAERGDQLDKVLFAECVGRGLLAPDADGDLRPDEVKPFTPDQWGAFYKEVAGAIE